MFISILSLALNCIFDYLAVRVFGFGIAGVAAFAVVGYASYFVEMIIIGI